MRKSIMFVFGVFGVCVMLLAGCCEDTHCCGSNLLSVASEDCDQATFVKAICYACLDKELKNCGPYTVFVPENAAFAKLPGGVLDSYLKAENYPQLRALMSYHIVRGRHDYYDLCMNRKLKSLCDHDLYVTQCCDSLYVNGARIIKSDIKASNGIIHIVDRVIEP